MCFWAQALVMKMMEEKYSHIPSEVRLCPPLKRKLLSPENIRSIEDPAFLRRSGGRDKLFDEFTLFFDVFISGDGKSIFALGPRNRDLESFECLVLGGQLLRIAGVTTSKGVDRVLLIRFLLPKSLCGRNSFKVKIFYKMGGKTFETPVLNPVKNSWPGKRLRLAGCTIICNESSRLASWIEYHLGLGVEHFFIYDNKSTDVEDLHRVLDKYIRGGIVTLFHWPYAYGVGFSAADRFAQTGAFCHCLNWQSAADWIMFYDVDEYFFPLKRNSLLPFVNEAEKEGFYQVHAKWVFFGPESTGNGKFKKIPAVTDMNFRHAELNSTEPYSEGAIKSIVDARKIFYMGDHYANNSDNRKRKFLPLDVMRVNHYNLPRFHERILGGKTRPFFDDSIKRFYSKKSYWTRLLEGFR